LLPAFVKVQPTFETKYVVTVFHDSAFVLCIRAVIDIKAIENEAIKTQIKNQQSTITTPWVPPSDVKNLTGLLAANLIGLPTQFMTVCCDIFYDCPEWLLVFCFRVFLLSTIDISWSRNTLSNLHIFRNWCVCVYVYEFVRLDEEYAHVRSPAN
jgi:hypothetical protein